MASNGEGARGRPESGQWAEVATAEGLRDAGDGVRGAPAESYAASPAPAVVRAGRSTWQGAAQRPHGDEEVAIPEAYNLDRDRVRWGPIWAGLLTALTALLLLSLLGLAIGLTTANAGEAVARGIGPANAGRNSAIWGGLSAVVAFLLGGYVAGRAAAIFDRKWGALNGALVFLVAVPLLLWLAAQGLGAVAGSLGTFAQGLNVDPTQVRAAAQGAANQAQQAAQSATPEQARAAAEAARNTAWATLFGALLGLGASVVGGLLGTRRALAVDTTGRRERISD